MKKEVLMIIVALIVGIVLMIIRIPVTDKIHELMVKIKNR